jgi:addiction module HigA family antidote
MSIKNPPHPGDFIRTQIIEPAGLTVTASVAALQVSRPALSSLLNGKADLSGDMALRIEKAFGVSPEQSENSIAGRMSHITVKPMDRLDHQVDGRVEDRPSLLRIYALD